MCLILGVADRGTDHAVKLFQVFGCQIGQITVLAMVPDLLNRVKVRKKQAEVADQQ